MKTGVKARHRVEYDDEKDFITIEANRWEPTSINRSLGDLLEEIIADLRSRNQCLTDLSGLLDGPAADADINERRATPIVSFKISGTAEVWTRKAIDSFPQIDVTLAERLGEANWQRYQRVSKKLNGTDYSEDQSGSGSDDSEEDRPPGLHRGYQIKRRSQLCLQLSRTADNYHWDICLQQPV